MEWLGILFVVVAGVLNAFQTAINASLTKSLGHVGLAAPVVFGIALVFTLLMLPFAGVTLSDFGRLTKTPWWSYLGGLCGAVFIFAMLSQTDKLGPGIFVAATVTSSVATSVVIDHFGWLGVDVHPATLWRIVGVLCMLAGVTLIAKF